MRKLIIMFLVFFTISCKGQQNLDKQPEISFQPDKTSLIRNPCMGWGLYDDAAGEVANAEEYWSKQDNAAKQYSSFFYVRWRWSDMEPEEGKYAWIYDDNYKSLIKGALDRGLKLCFCIYDNGQHNLRQGTPDFVRLAGAKGYYVDGPNDEEHQGLKHWTPYADDPIFQEKLTNFVKALAKEYDNPDIVDFVDGFNLGWWGEAHHIVLTGDICVGHPLFKEKLLPVFEWYTSLYKSNFKNVIISAPFNNEVGFMDEKRIVYDTKEYTMRRNGLGSQWFTDWEKSYAKAMYGEVPLLGEQCYWGEYPLWESDTAYDFATWRDVYEQTYRDAVSCHFNTLDLRTIVDADRWISCATDLVQKFMIEGGYRIYPTELVLPNKVRQEESVLISHTWCNIGCGYLPNNMKNWNYKYKVAFALLNGNNEVVKMWVDNEAEPSEWLKDKKKLYEYKVIINDIQPGNYKWAVAIIDSTKGIPGIKLAIKDNKVVNGWSIVGDCCVINK